METARPDMVAGHSLGEFSALTANGTLSFEDALNLVSVRATAMQKACELQPSTMAAVLALDDEKVESICEQVQEETGEIVVPANYNCPGQLVISGTVKGIEIAIEKLKAAGAKRALVLPVGGAFHSPLMEPAKVELKEAIEKTSFHQPTSHVYQNVVARAVHDKEEIKQNLIDQLTNAVKWTQSVQVMIKDGATKFTEVGPGKVLQGLIAKIDKSVSIDGVS
jgi:[acyl-carrier-protein] S-malonyltransferase